jgi:hypothetical protein
MIPGFWIELLKRCSVIGRGKGLRCGGKINVSHSRYKMSFRYPNENVE